MSEGRALVNPQLLSLGARPVDLPEIGHVLVASSIFAFDLATLAPVRAPEWYEQVAVAAGPYVVPDSLCPLPGAEVLVLGRGVPVSGRHRDGRLAVSSRDVGFRLRPDPGRPGADARLDFAAARRDPKLNPGGVDDGEPLIVDLADVERPLWLDQTPQDHPARFEALGEMAENAGPGWPPGTSRDVLFDAHPSLRLERIDPGDRVVLEGVASTDIDFRIPPYRVVITSGHDNGDVRVEPARIHTLALLPSAGIGAAIWRVAIPLGTDVLGEKVVALIAALREVELPEPEPEHYGLIAANRWLKPENALDDRPLLPAALAASVVLPWQLPPEGDAVSERVADAKSWMEAEIGATNGNPFASKAGPEAGLADSVVEGAHDPDKLPEGKDVAEMADDALALARKRHADAGFAERPVEDLEPEPRGERLAGEIRTRLGGPYRSPRERLLRRGLSTAKEMGMSPGPDPFEALADARALLATPGLPWPLLPEDEALEFGAAIAEHVEEHPLERHLDLSGARFRELRFDGVAFPSIFAEKTVFEDVSFVRSDLAGTSFAGALFERCRFEQVSFTRVNISGVRFLDCEFVDCVFESVIASDLGFVRPVFREVRFLDVTLNDTAAEAGRFEHSQLSSVRITDSFWFDMVFEHCSFDDVSLMGVDAPRWTFTDVKLHKTWFMHRGLPGSTFRRVIFDTCGFFDFYRLDQSHFASVHFVRTGFTNACFAQAVFEPGCIFEECDLTGAVLGTALVCGVRFVRCSMVMTRWGGETDARAAWFVGCRLRAVDFADTDLTEAVFADADISEARMLPDKVIGADFRGTVRSEGGREG